MRRNKNRGYQKLRVWNDAVAYYKQTWEVFRKLPYESRRVASQQIASSDSVKNPVREHGASSIEKAFYIWGADRQRTSLVRHQTHMAIYPRSEKRGILAFSRASKYSRRILQTIDS